LIQRNISRFVQWLSRLPILGKIVKANSISPKVSTKRLGPFNFASEDDAGLFREKTCRDMTIFVVFDREASALDGPFGLMLIESARRSKGRVFVKNTPKIAICNSEVGF
jgi:hypothetical protein